MASISLGVIGKILEHGLQCEMSNSRCSRRSRSANGHAGAPNWVSLTLNVMPGPPPVRNFDSVTGIVLVGVTWVKLVLPPVPSVPLSARWQPWQVLSENWWRAQIPLGVAGTMLASQKLAPTPAVSALPPRNATGGLPGALKKNGMVYDVSHWLGSTTG